MRSRHSHIGCVPTTHTPDTNSDTYHQLMTGLGVPVRVMIFEVTDPNWPAQEAVRIFVEFTKPDGSIK
eukprot:2470324-Pyramimonas_sp.AAC.1